MALSTAAIAPLTVVVANGSVAQSITDALAYCTRRGVPQANIRVFNFGANENGINLDALYYTTTPAYGSTYLACDNGNAAYAAQPFYNPAIQGQSVFSVLGTDFANGALACLLSTYTPTYVPNNDGYASPLCNVLLGATYFNRVYARFGSTAYTWWDYTWGQGGYFAQKYPTDNQHTVNTQAKLEANTITADWPTITELRAGGRLGCPVLKGRAVMPYALAEVAVAPATGYSSVVDCATVNAIAQEKVDHRLDPVWVSSNQTDGTWFQTGESAAYYGLIGAHDFRNVRDVGDGATGFWVDFNINTFPYSTPLPSLFCVLVQSSPNGTNLFPSNDTNYYFDGNTVYQQKNYSLVPGAFGGAWWSYSWNFGMGLMYHGASAAIMTIEEPQGPYLGYPQFYFRYLMQGVPIGLAQICSPTAFKGSSAPLRHMVVGDPLYAPFTVTPLTGKMLPGGVQVQ